MNSPKLTFAFLFALCQWISINHSSFAQTSQNYQPKLLADSARELTPLREWTLRDGTKLSGLATTSGKEESLGDEVVISDPSRQLQLVVQLDDFVPAQGAELLKLLARDESFLLKFGRPNFNLELMPWKGTPPQGHENMQLWALDNGRVIGKFGTGFYEIDSKLVDMDAVKLKQQSVFDPLNPGGRYFAIACQDVGVAMDVRPVGSTNSEFIFECGPQMATRTGQLVRAPKFMFSKRMLAAIAGLEKLEAKSVTQTLDAASIAKLPCVRRALGIYTTVGPLSSDFKSINMVVKDSAHPEVESSYQIPNPPFQKVDYLNFLLNARGISLQQADIEDKLRLKQVSAPVIQDFLKLATLNDTAWAIHGCSSLLVGRVLAKVKDDVYVQRQGDPTVFIANIEQFAPVDQLVIELTMAQNDNQAYVKSLGQEKPPRLIPAYGNAMTVVSPFAEDKLPYCFTPQGERYRLVNLTLADYKNLLGEKKIEPAKTAQTDPNKVASNSGRMPSGATSDTSKRPTDSPAGKPEPTTPPKVKTEEPIARIAGPFGPYHAKTEFKLTNGQTVYGIPSKSTLASHAVLMAERGGYAPPDELHVPYGLFAAEDRLAMLASFYYPNQYARYAFLDPCAKSIEGWGIGEPPEAAEIEKVVEVSHGKIFATTRDYLLEIDEKIVSAEALAKLKAAFEAAGGGQYMTVIDGNLKFAGKLIAQSADDYVFEAGNNGDAIEFVLPPGTRYRVPKYLLNPILAKQFEAIYREVESRFWILSLTPKEILAMPCYRMSGGQSKLCYPSDSMDAEQIKIARRNAQSDSTRAVDLNCADQFAQERDTRLNLGMDRDKVNTEALLTVAEMAGKRLCWNMRGLSLDFYGKLVGNFEDGYVFEIGSFGPVFVMASQLNPVDAKVAAIATREFDKKWVDAVDWDKFLKNRIMFSFGVSRVVHAEGTVQVDSTIRGSIPVLAELHGAEYRTAGWHLDSLLDIAKVSSQLKFFQNAQQAKARAKEPYSPSGNANLAASIPKREAINPTADADLPSLKSKLPKLEMERWELNADNYFFEATLAGEFKDDFVFVAKFEGKERSFLVGKSLLKEKDRKRVEGLLSRMPRVDWTLKLDRARDWQYYRIWFDPTDKRFIDRSPMIVRSIEKNSVFFNYFDDRLATSLLASPGPKREQIIAPYVAVLEEASNRKQAAESKLESWELRESSAVIKANYVSQTDDDVILRNVDQVLCLFAKSNLKEEVRKEISTRPRTKVETAELPRWWCGREKLFGPGALERVNQGSALVFREPSGLPGSAEWRELTLREQLLAESEWLRKSKGLTDDRSIDFVLEAPVAANEMVTETPALSVSLKQRIDANAHWEIYEWESTPIKVDPQAKMLAMDREANTVIALLPDKSCQSIEVATGTVTKLDKADFSNTQFGPWLLDGADRIGSVEDGKLVSRDALGTVTMLSPAGSPAIIAAGQSGDFQSIVVVYSNGAMFRHELASGKLTSLRTEVPSFKAEPNAKLWASRDGYAAVMTSQQGMVAIGFDKNGKNAPKEFPSEAKRKVLTAAMNDNMGLFVMEESLHPSMLPLNASDKDVVTYTGYTPKRISYVDLDGLEVLQYIGRPADKFYDRLSFYFVQQHELQGSNRDYAHQIIVGEIDEHSILAANGSALLHTRDGKPVLSRRPQVVPKNLNLVLAKIASELVEQRDIGQLEAVARYLEQSQFAELRTYRNQIADDFLTLVLGASQSHMAHAGGDRLERQYRFAKHLMAKYPNSQIARNVLVSLYQREAWDARGSGYASRVSDIGWEMFRASMAEAKKHLDALLSADRPMAVSYKQAINIAMATSESLENVQRLAGDILKGDHAENADLHNAIALLLLPRWHGEPGMTEAYLENVARRIGGNAGDVVYAKAVMSLSAISSGKAPVTAELNLNVDRLVNGTKSFYETRTDPDLIEGMITLLWLKTKKPQVRELFQLRADKRIPPGTTSARNSLDFQSILENSRFLRMAK